tara:strand:+ start:1915 stop:2136 length:222 start_codon:yes stop_codon:yes gene_type:complete
MSMEIRLPFKGKFVNWYSLQVEGVDTRDYPDFCDCWISYGEWADGTPLTESELEDIQEEYSDLAYEIAIATIY